MMPFLEIVPVQDKSELTAEGVCYNLGTQYVLDTNMYPYITKGCLFGNMSLSQNNARSSKGSAGVLTIKRHRSLKL